MNNSDKNNVTLKLHSAKKNSLLNCINSERNLDLLKNQMKKLNEEKHKIMTKINNSENAQKLREQRKIDVCWVECYYCLGMPIEACRH